jgi:putative protease
MESDVVSLKIEGRMKSPEYVGFITKFYRTLIDKYYNKEEMIINENELNELKTLFNREFTNGYLFDKYGKDVMNIKNQNHIGLEIGKVIEVDSKYIKIKLEHDLNQEDGIKFLDVDKGMIVNKLYNQKLMLVNKIEKGNIAIVDNKIGLKTLSRVSITTNKLLLENLNKYIKKKLDISFLVKAKKGLNLEIIADDGLNKVKVEGNVVLESINRPVTIDNITNQLSKLGNTPFKLKDINVDLDDDVFISLKELNDLRRELVDKLVELKIKVPNKKINVIENGQFISKNKQNKIGALVRNEDQLICCLGNDIDYIYVSDIGLFNKYRNNQNIYLRLDRVMNNFVDYKGENLLVCELGAINKYRLNNNVVTDYYLNINNNYSVKFLEKLGVHRICLSPETKDFNNIHSNIDVEMIAYGRLELMITKYCPLNMILNKDNKKCNLCLNKDKFYLKDDQNRMYPLIHSKHLTHIMHYKNIDIINNIRDYQDKGINCFRLELFDESKDDVIKLINKLRGSL